MRAAPAIAAGILALAACKVDVEGAPCGAPGNTIDCPSGQACGNDGKCSARAATCTRCTPGETLCGGGEGTVLAKRCTDADPVCGAWESEDCGARGLVCGWHTDTSPAGCMCPPGFNGPDFAADPIAGRGADESPFPTGAPSPPECRFRRLGDAIAAAAAVSGPATVQAYAAEPGQSQVIFGDAASGEEPITIPANVTVVSSAAVATSLRFESPTSAPLVTLEGSLVGFAIQDVAATGVAVAVSCGAAGVPSLTNVAVDGGGALSAGVDVAGACGAALSGVTVARAAGPALRIHADPSAPVSVRGGALRDSGVGARVTGGRVSFGVEGDPTMFVEIAANANEGVVVAAGAATAVRLDGANVHANGGTGIVLDLASVGSAVTVQGCDISSNGKVAPRTYGPAGSTRAVGGVLVAQGALPFTFAGNRVYANAGDQLAFESSAAWSIAPLACGASSNVFACVPSGANGPYAVGVAGGGSVGARFTVWPDVPIAPFVGPGVTGSSFWCEKDQAGVPATPACPTP